MRSIKYPIINSKLATSMNTCWCPDTIHSQGINWHRIHYVRSEDSHLPQGKIYKDKNFPSPLMATVMFPPVSSWRHSNLLRLTNQHQRSYAGQSLVMRQGWNHGVRPQSWHQLDGSLYYQLQKRLNVGIILKNLLQHAARIKTLALTHCGLVMPYSDICLGQHWLR